MIISDDITLICSKENCECDGCGCDVDVGELLMCAKGMNEKIFICTECVKETASKIEELENGII